MTPGGWRRNGPSGSTALGRLIHAGVAGRRGQTETAMLALREAAVSLDTLEMSLFAAAAWRQLGRLCGGDEGVGLVTRADSLMTANGVSNPARMTALLVPGFPD